MKLFFKYLISIILMLIILHQFFVYFNEKSKVTNNVYSVSFKGAVELISNNRGFKVKLKNEPQYYYLDGAEEQDTIYLADSITWGDTLSKQANSNIIILKSHTTGKTTKWLIP